MYRSTASALLLLAAGACVPDYDSDDASGDGLVEDGDTGLDEDTDGSGGGGGDDGGDDGDDGGDDGGDDAPAWVGTFSAKYSIVTPREDDFCVGEIELVMDASGSLSGEADCEVLRGPSEGDTVPLLVRADADDPSAETTDLEGEVFLELRTRNGGTHDPAEATGEAGPDSIFIDFVLPIGRNDDGFPGSIETY